MNRLWAGLKGRGYETLLRAGLVRYRRPFTSFTEQIWDDGYARGEHDHYERLPELGRYSVIAGYLGFGPGPSDILEIGCGAGILRNRIPDDLVRSYEGYDTGPHAIAQARARQHTRSRYHVGRAPQGQTFDVILCNEVLYLIPDFEAVIEQLAGLLRPEGRLITSNTRYHGDFVLRDALARHFALLDETVVINVAERKKWRVGYYKGKTRP